ncbi:hypothetical protein GCM10009858_02740 [Terrabacter carboxydivorans]|uniref:Uncharacterized protein n=1 Tax=Terrabacter carboxydivorans TaxID=619730 RepID=A0ABP5Y114_9MICO
MERNVARRQAAQGLRQVTACVRWSLVNASVAWGATLYGDLRIHAEWVSTNPPPILGIGTEAALRRDVSQGIVAIEDYLASIPSVPVQHTSTEPGGEPDGYWVDDGALTVSRGRDHKVWTTRRHVHFWRPARGGLDP